MAARWIIDGKPQKPVAHRVADKRADGVDVGEPVAVGYRRYGLTDDDLADQLKQISRDARRFADEVGDRYVGGFPITVEAMKVMLEKHGYTVTGGDS